MKPDTLCLHADNNKKDVWGTISMPVCQAATFVHDGNGNSLYSYSRLSNPTRDHLEHTVAVLEGGTSAVAFSSGMAAETVLFQIFAPPAHIIATDDMYGGTLRLFREVYEKSGYSFDFTDTGDLSAVEKLIKPETKAIYVESPSNPLMQVTDIAAIARLAHAHGLLLIVDNTFLSPYFQNPIALGADIVVHSGTKYLGGHNDVLAGFLVVANEELGERVRFYAKTIGACLAPWDCFLVERGIKTLAVRMERINENAKLVAAFLRNDPHVKKVYYAGFADRADYEISLKQTRGFGGMISFEADNENTVKHLLADVRVFQYAESLGGTESLITYPVRQTHADVPKEEREARGINDRFLRISVGIENAQDLIEDLKQAFAGADEDKK